MNFLDYLNNHIVYLDGATGTLLQERGLPSGCAPETWNTSHKDDVEAVHKAYFDAGSNVVLTNTFGVNGLKYTDDEIETLVSSAVQCADAARKNSRTSQEKFVALDIGPLGRLLSPLGTLDFEEAVYAFKKAIQVGTKAGCDLIFIETMSDAFETKAAVVAAKEVSSLPLVVSNAYGEDGRLMSGATPSVMVAMLEGLGVDAIGVNCSLGPDAVAPIIEEYVALSSLPIVCKPNAGLPRVENGTTVFDVSPDSFSEKMSGILACGARIVGGCCGTTPRYLAALVEATKDIIPAEIIEKATTVVSSGIQAVALGGVPILIGERINPTGKKRFKQALLNGDMPFILNEGIRQQACGVHILDVNVGMPEIDEAKMLPSVVQELQAVCELPLQLDTSNPIAMEAAMRRYNGKPLINSVNGKQAIMDAVFPLIRKYGGVVVALTLDERGIPETVDERLAIAQNILATAKRYGISAKDILFDPLTMAVSADQNAAVTTLECIRRLSDELGCKTILGVSNVSFGLPQRANINSVFFVCALELGLSAAIMNPFSSEMMNAYYAWRVLKKHDENCLDYIRYAEQNEVQSVSPSSLDVTLKEAILRGIKEKAASCTKALLADTLPLTVVQNEILPALNQVGADYEAKRCFLPQLLMSAEAASSAFEEIKAAMQGNESPTNGIRVVLATVEGDVHDIGKNTVRLLLENYGFLVTDLGKDVKPQAIVDAAKTLHAPLVGLSALMTTTVPKMEETIALLREETPWCKVVVGGAVLNKDYAERIGADRYAKDAMDTVRFAQEFQNK